MADAWSDLREGAIRKFCFVEVDLAGHSEIARNNSTEDAHATFSAFLDYIEERAQAHGAVRRGVWRGMGDYLRSATTV